MNEVVPCSIPALGRPFELGQLYDQASDRLYVGNTIWPEEQINKNKSSKVDKTQRAEVFIEDSVDAKVSKFQCTGEVKLSLMGGLIKPSGSASYITDNVSNSQTSRVTLTQKRTYRTETLNVNKLASYIIDRTFDNKKATHFVVGIKYGCDAHFVFELDASDAKDKQKLSGSLQVEVNLLKTSTWGIENVSGSMEYENNSEIKSENISCKYYGDYHLDQMPTSFQEANQAIKQLSKISDDDDKNAVAIEIYLHPVHLLKATKKKKLLAQIKDSVIDEIAHYYDDCNDISATCNALMNNNVCKQFNHLQEKLRNINGRAKTHVSEIANQLNNLVPQVRLGDKTEGALLEMKTGYNHTLRKELTEVQEEISFLQGYIKALQHIDFISKEGEANGFVLTHEKVLLLHFNLFHPLQSGSEPWYKDKDLLSAMNKSINSFATFSKSDLTFSKSDLYLIATVGSNRSKSCGVSIFYYLNSEIKSSGSTPSEAMMPSTQTSDTDDDYQ